MAALKITRANATELSANHWNASFDHVDLDGGYQALTTDLGNGQPFTAIGFSEDAAHEMCAIHYVQTSSPLTLVLGSSFLTLYALSMATPRNSPSWREHCIAERPNRVHHVGIMPGREYR
jgi:hypothetical protein